VTKHETRRGIDWDAVRARIRENVAALERGDEDESRRREVFRRRAARLATRGRRESAPADALAVLTFFLGGERYGLPLGAVASVRPAENLAPVPGGPAELVGVVAVQGVVRSVLDLARLVDRPSDSAKGYVLMMRHSGGEFGLRVDRLDTVDSVRRDDVQQPAAGTDAPARCVSGVVPGRLVLLDPDALARHPVFATTRPDTV
jgi:purine-binding chemotaxis protein CheW